MAESLESELWKPEQNAVATDRISSLPDSVICHILSFLPTRTSVATSILSRRWRHMWEHLQVLHFYDNSYEFYNESDDLFKRFTVFVNGVLALRKARDIRKFRLKCGHSHSDSFNANSVAMWIRTAIGPHLEELHLTLYSIDDDAFVMPHSLFTCTKLVSLSLYGGIHLQLPSMVHLPYLKMLQLDIDSVDSIDTLLPGCPALETLNLSLDAKHLTKIRVPSTLKSFKFEVVHCGETDLEIDAPGLQFLSITQKSLSFRCSVGDLHNVVEAYLDVFVVDEPNNTLLKLLKALCGTESLVLRSSTTQWLRHTPIMNFSEFHYLLHLELTLSCFDSSFLVNMLQKCPILQVLKIRIEKEPSLLRDWRRPTSVPNCLVSHLTIIKFRGYQGIPDEQAFIAYILQRGLVLKTMTICIDISLDLEKRHHILKELSVIPRASNMCQLDFD